MVRFSTVAMVRKREQDAPIEMAMCDSENEFFEKYATVTFTRLEIENKPQLRPIQFNSAHPKMK